MNFGNRFGLWPIEMPQWWHQLLRRLSRPAVNPSCRAANLERLREQFAAPGAFLIEMLKAGVYNGANVIDVQWDQSQRLLSFRNGWGRDAHLTDLFSVRHSAWDLDSIAQIHPFAVGFCALLMACKKIEIQARQGTYLIDTAAFVRGEAPTCTTAREHFDTRWLLWLHQSHCPPPGYSHRLDMAEAMQSAWHAMLSKIARGFPLPIYVNGAKVERPLALKALEVPEYTDLGVLYMEPMELAVLSQEPTLFCEGFQVGPQQNTTSDVVLHLDPKRFALRPGEQLSAEQRQQVDALILAERQRLLPWYRQQVGVEAFVDCYWELCEPLQMPELLADAPVAISMLSYYTQPVNALHEDCTHRDKWQRRWNLPVAGTLFVTDLQAQHAARKGHSAAPLASLFAKVHGLAILDPKVPATHPARAWQVDLLASGVRIVCELENGGPIVPFHGTYGRCSVQRCRSVVLRCELTEQATRLLRAEVVEALLRLPAKRLTNIAVCDGESRRIFVAGDARDLAAVPARLFAYNTPQFNGQPANAHWQQVMANDLKNLNLTVMSLAHC
jgi:hypothetical protein